MKVTKQQLGDAFTKAAGQNFQPIPVLEFKKLMCEFLKEDNEDDEALLNARAFLFGMQLCMRMTLNRANELSGDLRATTLHMAKLLRMAQTEIGTGKEPIPNFTAEEAKMVIDLQRAAKVKGDEDGSI